MLTQKPSNNRALKGIYLLPNLFTMAALFSGFFAIIAATQHHFQSAAIAIFIAMLWDALDGRVARLTHTQSKFGAEFDSLSDMLCFGLSPALVLYYWSLSSFGKVGWLAAFLYTACTALRLARFGSFDQNEDKRYFQGLSTTAAAGLIAGFIWFSVTKGFVGTDTIMRMASIIITVLVALLKVSTIRYRSFKDIDVRKSVSFMAILILLPLFVLVSLDPADTLFCLFAAYGLSGPIEMVFHRPKKRKTE